VFEKERNLLYQRTREISLTGAKRTRKRRKMMRKKSSS